jgi:hypothetical protein
MAVGESSSPSSSCSSPFRNCEIEPVDVRLMSSVATAVAASKSADASALAGAPRPPGTTVFEELFFGGSTSASLRLFC